jgi:PHP domain
MPAPADRPRRPRWARWGAIAGLLVVALGIGYGAVASLGPLAPPAGWPPPSDLFEYTAAMHVHSAYSHDGQGSVEEIAAAASRAGVRIVFLTDHNTLAPLAEDKERWHGDTLVLVGAEVTTGSGYLLVLDPRPDVPVRARGLSIGDLMGRYREAGALVLLAHPGHPRLGWRGPVPPVEGIEVIDVFDQLMAVPLGRKMVGLAAYPANPVMAVLSWIHWPRAVLARWDEMARERPTIGVLALDAHGGIAVTDETDLWFPSHETSFRLGRLHLLLAERLHRNAADRLRVYRALRAGRFYNAFDGFAPADGFRFEVRLGEARAVMGESVPFRAGQTAVIRVPPVGPAQLRLFRDGAVVHEGPAEALVTVPLAGPGVYRVEVDLQVDLFPIAGIAFRPWIFSNPVYVTR